MKRQIKKTIFVRLFDLVFDNNEVKHLVILGLLFAVLLGVSLLFFAFHQNDKARRVLFFPDFKTGKLIPETRYVKLEKDSFRNVTVLIEELAGGSALPNRARLLPMGTKIISVFKKDRTLYLNFSNDILAVDDKGPVDFSAVIQSLVNNLLFNFKDIKQIVFYIENELLPLQVKKANNEIRQIYKNEFDNRILQ